jgi:hypothetical protein
MRAFRAIGLTLAVATLANAPSALARPSAGSLQAHTSQDHQVAGGGYYIEFRVAQIGTYGHSYVAYGRSGGQQHYADLHPMGGYAGMALGHVVPVPANVQWDSDVLKLPVVSRYRRPLSAQQYGKLLAALTAAKRNKQPYWNAVTNNCNHFIGNLAQVVGLKVPEQFQVSYTFVPTLKELNENDAETRNSQIRKRHPR